MGFVSQNDFMTATAAKIETHFPLPPQCVFTRNSPPAHQLSTAILYQSFRVSNSNTTTGIAACLYDSGRRSRSTSKERDSEMPPQRFNNVEM
jgi:hypothetical protein